MCKRFSKYSKADDSNFFAKTLERATGAVLPACVHRVAPLHSHERLSLVFLLRARPDAILNSAALGSSLLDGIEAEPAMTVAEFFKQVYLQRRCVPERNWWN